MRSTECLLVLSLSSVLTYFVRTAGRGQQGAESGEKEGNGRDV